MTATAHALVGGAIAATFKDPVLGLTLSAASHPVLDLIPHWDFGWGWKQKTKIKLVLQAVFDLSLGLALTWILFGQNTDLIYLTGCVFMSEVWDIMEAPYLFLNWRFPPFSTFYNIQSKLQGKAKNMFIGILTQVAAVAGIVLVLRELSPH